MIISQDHTASQPKRELEDKAVTSDHLQLAGSDLSLREILEREYTIPVRKFGKFNVSDVDKLFNVINGVFANISEEAVCKEVRLTNLSEQLDGLTKERDQLATEKEYLVDQNAAMLQKEDGYRQIIDQLRSLVSEYVDNDASLDQVADLQKELDAKTQENEQLRKAIGILYQQNDYLKKQKS